jgi:hypothetical protein
MTRRRVARPIPEDAPTVLRTIKECHHRNALPVMMTTWSFMPSRLLSGISKLVILAIQRSGFKMLASEKAIVLVERNMTTKINVQIPQFNE